MKIGVVSDAHGNPYGLKTCIDFLRVRAQVARIYFLGDAVGYLPESPPLYPEMDVRGYLTYVARLKDVARAGLRDAVDRAIDPTIPYRGNAQHIALGAPSPHAVRRFTSRHRLRIDCSSAK